MHKKLFTNLIPLYSSKVSGSPPRTFLECIKYIKLQILFNFFRNSLEVHLGHFGNALKNLDFGANYIVHRK